MERSKKEKNSMKRVKASSVILAGLLASVMSAMPAFGQEAGGMEEAQDVAASQEVVNFDESWQWASSSEIHTGSAVLYRAGGSLEAPGRKNFTVCVNAGHGTAGGEGVQTLSHPDGTPKVTGGTNAEGAVYSTAISSGMAFLDGTPEASANLMTALALKELLLSTQSDKGVYFCSVPSDASYRQMEPVASHWQEHMALGQSLIQGLAANGFALFGDGTLEMDLTQTSYSTIPSVDIEVGDGASDHSQEACAARARGLRDGISLYYDSLQTAQ